MSSALLPVSAVLCAALAVGGCGTEEMPARSSPGAAATSPAILSRAARLEAIGQPFTLLSVPKVGRVLVTCDRRGRSRISLRSARLLPTADVLVDVAGRQRVARTIQPQRLFTPDKTARRAAHQTWHIAPFAAGGVRLTAISVTTQALHERGAIFRCAASAMAIVGSDQGATAER